MTAEAYWSLSIDLPRHRFEALRSWLLDYGFSSFEQRDAAFGITVIVYATGRTALERLEREVSSAAAESGLAPLRFRLAQVPSDWALEWTKHLAPVALTPALTLYPHRPAHAPAAGALYLEPAFAFGFGEHASTRLAARWLEGECRRRPGGSVLDVGCGTGVLALVASASGAARVLGIDVSDAAIVAARRNAELNGIEARVAFDRQGIAQVVGVFDHVVANIEAGVLCELAPHIARRVAPGGVLGLAGFIREQSDAVARRYAREGLRLEPSDREDDWCLLVGTVDGQVAESVQSF